ncbi:hypothetical protein [Pseudoduganella sp. R-43]|uniref:hypothetical protein n=1 Tax=unclassified Pseudoduganella TaxID=2637179 RepID=UPI003CF3DB8E
MKIRSSVKKSNWGESREAFYRQEANNIAYSLKGKLAVRGADVFLQQGGSEVHLVTERQTTALWFDVWTALKEKFPGF